MTTQTYFVEATYTLRPLQIMDAAGAVRTTGYATDVAVDVYEEPGYQADLVCSIPRTARFPVEQGQRIAAALESDGTAASAARVVRRYIVDGRTVERDEFEAVRNGIPA